MLDLSYPFYNSSSCPFIDAEIDCQKYGRPDKQYMKFHGGEMLRRWKGEKIMFVGYSLSLNMWESLSSMIVALVDPHRKSQGINCRVIDYKIARWDYMQVGNGTLFKDMDRFNAFFMGLTTWAKWVDHSVDPSKTRVFFQGISPTHYQ
ncbi:hypothetical protein SAY86_020703 [Trapa natans]|uniref:Uncharacterized protein n=1 Tax=Trapa natans TaxID=22666 RepID=A0AAN7LQ65_TRANT|nr:hypothetical protein SAY86_020703 [Trapa natans]